MKIPRFDCLYQFTIAAVTVVHDGPLYQPLHFDNMLLSSLFFFVSCWLTCMIAVDDSQSLTLQLKLHFFGHSYKIPKIKPKRLVQNPINDALQKFNSAPIGFTPAIHAYILHSHATYTNRVMDGNVCNPSTDQKYTKMSLLALRGFNQE